MFRLLKNNRGQYTGGSGGGSSSATSNVSKGSGGGMSFGAAFALTSLMSAFSTIYMGKVQSDIAEYNARVIEERQKLIKIKQDIEYAQYERMKSRYISTAMTTVAGRGVKPTGSYMAKAVSSIKNMAIDQAIGQFDYTIQKSDVQSQATAVRNEGKDAKRAGYTRAFSEMLTGAKDYAMYKYGKKSLNLSSGAERGGKA